ncbi:nucleotide disphospho-sugar-binding domain-containing protein [Actinosynnema sp. NPDC023794]
MRFLFTAWPTPSHLFPLVPLAHALMGAGHEVRVASAPSLADAIRACGLTAVPLGDGSGTPTGPGKIAPADVSARFDDLAARLGLSGDELATWDVVRYFMLPPMWDFHPFGAAASDPHPEVDDLVEYTRVWRPDMVLWDPPFLAGSIAAKVNGVAHARLMWSQDYFPFAVRAMERAPGDWDPFVETVRPAAERHGVEVDEELLLGQFTVDAMPTGMRLPDATKAMPMRWVPFTGTTTIPDWLHAERSRPRVALSLGQSRRLVIKDDGWDPMADVLDMVGQLDVEVVATLDATQLANVPSVPDNVRVIDYMPLNVLLPTCDAIIHHGAIGTFGAAATFKVPQLIVDSHAQHLNPAFGDEWSAACRTMISKNAARYVPDRGAGFALDVQGAPEEARTRIKVVLEEPGIRDGVERVHAELMATPSPHDVVPELEEAARRGRTA